MTLRRVLTGVGVVLVLAAASYVLADPAISDPTVPAWEPEAGVLGTITLYDGTGAPVTGGELDGHPAVAYAAASGPGRTGDTKAQLKIFTPLVGVLPVLWNGDTLTGATDYPAKSAPAPVRNLTVPVATGTAGDLSVADFVEELPNLLTQPGYANLYELRLYTSGPGQTQNVAYFRVDIEVSGASWSVVYPSGGSTGPGGPTGGQTSGGQTTGPAAPTTVTVTTTVTATETAPGTTPPDTTTPTTAAPTTAPATTAAAVTVPPAGPPATGAPAGEPSTLQPVAVGAITPTALPAPSGSATTPSPAPAPPGSGGPTAPLGGRLSLAGNSTSAAAFAGLGLAVVVASAGGVAAAVSIRRRNAGRF
jgi:hypothetical protein